VLSSLLAQFCSTFYYLADRLSKQGCRGLRRDDRVTLTNGTSIVKSSFEALNQWPYIPRLIAFAKIVGNSEILVPA
jgi:hypothetical protein